MIENSKQAIVVMALCVVTRDSILSCANELGIPEEQVTDNVIKLVKEKVNQDLGDWLDGIRGIVKEAFKEAIEKETVKCPLRLACSPSCAFRQVGECSSSKGTK